ncbi:MAG: DUF2971 domain-containing protein [Acidobacteria bacterium]|nr:MAG: DUF2971 domain-containing protein [Acidobacteriota bacterium]
MFLGIYMQVYKFLPAGFALDDLRKRRLKISTFDDMNDPFELKGAAHSNTYVQRLLTAHSASHYGVLCFSRNWSNPVLWSHYADRHRGICLGFETGDTVEAHQPCYADSPLTLNSDALLDAVRRGRDLKESDQEFRAAQKVTENLLLTKFRAWDYEDEIRVFVSLEKRDCNFYFYDFGKEIHPNIVIAGSRCTVPKGEIKAAVTGYSPPIRIVEAMLSSNSFEVVEDMQADADTKAG